MRVLPHHQDTGGFFIAVLEKKDWLPWQRKQRRTQQSTTMETKTAATESVKDDADTGSDTNVATVPKLQHLAHKVAMSVEGSEEGVSNSSVSASVGPAESECTDSGQERTKVNPEGNGESIPCDEEVKGKTESSGGQERPSNVVLGKYVIFVAQLTVMCALCPY